MQGSMFNMYGRAAAFPNVYVVHQCAIANFKRNKCHGYVPLKWISYRNARVQSRGLKPSSTHIKSGCFSDIKIGI